MKDEGDTIERKKGLIPNIPFAPAHWPFYYGWVILVVGTLGVVVSAPGQTIGVAAFVEPLMNGTGLNRTTVSIAYGIGTMLSAMLLTFGGRLYDLIGARKSAAIASITMGLTLITLSHLEIITSSMEAFLPQISHNSIVFGFLVPAFLLLRFSGQGFLTLVSRNMVMKWFVHRRGLANGVMGVFIALGFSLSPRIFNSMIGAFSWQVAWRMLGLVSAVLFTGIVLVLYRDNPEACGLQPDGGRLSRPGDPPHRPAQDFTLRQALSTWCFWIFTMSLSLQALYGTAFAFHIESMMGEIGFDSATAYGIFVPSAIISVILGLLAGWISDHVQLNRLLAVHLAGMALSMVGMLINMQMITFILIIVGNGVASAVFGVLLGITWPRYFGRKHLGEISGFHLTMNVMFSAIGPAVFALSFSRIGSYRPAIWLCLVVVAVLFGLLPKAVRPRMEKQGQ